MDSLREIAEQRIAEDPFLQEAVHRGIVNATGLARWLKDKRGVEAQTEALAGPIRGIQKQADPSLLEQTRALLDAVEVQTLPGRVLFVVDREDRIEQRLSRLVADLDLRVDKLTLSTGRSTVRVTVDQDQQAAVAKALDPVLVKEPRQGLTELEVRTKDPAMGARVLGVTVQALTAVGVEVVHVDQGEKIVSILIEEDGTDQAWRIFDSGRDP